MKKDQNLPTLTLQLFTLAVALWAIISRFWVAEDAYITFRVIQNLYEGFGLVYNPGEAVEAFTHPLWMMMLVVLRGIGAPLHGGSILLGFTLTMSALLYLIFSPSPGGRRLLPIVPLGLVTISGFRDFATSGMELSLLFALLTLFYLALNEKSLLKLSPSMAALLSLIYLTRPELGILPGYYSLFLLFEWVRANRSSLRSARTSWKSLFAASGVLLQWGAVMVLVAGGYHLFRYIYYGELFPNTYYAKSGLAGYWEAGFKYLAYTLIWSPAWIIFLLGIGYFLGSARFRQERYRPLKLSLYRDLGALALLLLYVVRLGGDFMAFRFLLPEIMITGLLLYRIIATVADHPPFPADRILPSAGLFPQSFGATPYLLTTLLALLIFWPVPNFKGYVADERWVYMQNESQNPLTILKGQDYPWGKAGVGFRELQQCLGYPNFWISNSQYGARCSRGVGLGYFGYHAGPYVLIQDEQGLPNREVARMPVYVRTRPGHEHYLTLGDVIDKGALFCETGELQYDRIMQTPAGVVIRWDRDLLATLPQIHRRSVELGELKRRGSPIIKRLEKRFGLKVEALIDESAAWERDNLLRSKNSCWDSFAAENK